MYQVRVFQECNYNYHDESTEVKTLSLSLSLSLSNLNVIQIRTCGVPQNLRRNLPPRIRHHRVYYLFH